MTTVTAVLQAVLWIWFLGCTFTYRFGKILLVEGMGFKSVEFAMLCVYSLGLAAFHCFQPAGRWILAGILAVCSGRCSRQERPLACRIFPLLPVLRDGTVKIAADQRAKTICPLVRQGVRGMDPAFKDAVREAGKILAEDPEQRAFLEMLTAEQDELRALRERLCGAAGSGSGLF